MYYRKIAGSLYLLLCGDNQAVDLFLTLQTLLKEVALSQKDRHIMKNMPVFYIQQKCQNSYMKINSAQCLHLQL